MGHSIAPEGPHTITFHFPGWDSMVPFRRGDPQLMSKLTSIYPRFAPFFEAKQLMESLHSFLNLDPETGCLAFVEPSTEEVVRKWATAPKRGDFRIEEGELGFRWVDCEGVVVTVATFPKGKARAVVGVWQVHGIGISTRLSVELLGRREQWREVGGLDGKGLEEGPGHRGVRERVAELVGGTVGEGDVFLTGTGMAGIYGVLRTVAKARGGVVVALGAIFHSSWHMFEEREGGFKHFGDVGQGLVDKLEEWLPGKEVAMVFLEFPSNPILESADLVGLRRLATKYNFPLVVDDTIGSFANIDVLPAADVIVTSLTKSFSGYANVMAGSVVFNPTSPLYVSLKATYTSLFTNIFFAGDADVLLANSKDYLPRSKILNRNALALATLFHNDTQSPNAVVTKSLYPPFSTTIANFKQFQRKPTDEFPEPGYGCLLSADFKSEKVARAFYETIQFHQGPHLGAHETLAMNFNEAIWGDNKELAAYQASFGLLPTQIRFSVGLESVETLVDTVEEALEAARRANVDAA
ncbi:hypothetical protein OQA88_3747 [Cercophora sp. LCS_1]